MYSVLRIAIQSEEDTSDIVKSVLANPKTTRVGNLLVVTLAESKDLADHVTALDEFLQTLPTASDLRDMQNVSLNFDIAIYVSEHVEIAVKELMFPVELLDVMVSRKIALTLSVYPLA